MTETEKMSLNCLDLIALHKKFGKISELSLIILLGMSEYCEAYFGFNTQISFSTSHVFTPRKVKVIFISNFV